MNRRDKNMTRLLVTTQPITKEGLLFIMTDITKVSLHDDRLPFSRRFVPNFFKKKKRVLLFKLMFMFN